MGSKECSRCGKTKELRDFNRNRTKRDGRVSACRVCSVATARARRAGKPEDYRAYSRKWDKNHKSERRARDITRRQDLRRRAGCLIRSARERARKKGLLCTIDAPWVLSVFSGQAGRCLLTGILFDLEPATTGTHNYASPSLDRIDPSGGYTPDNTRLVCWAINEALSDRGEKTLELVCASFLRTRGFSVT